MTAPPLVRRFERLLDGPFDLLVVGGGIFGAWAAYDAASRGLRVAIVEQDDWASGTSSASSKLLHGVRFFHERGERRGLQAALAERRRLARLAPHRLRPVRVALPAGADARPRLTLKAGLWLHDRLGGPDQPGDPHRGFGRDAFSRRYPFLVPSRLRGGFTYTDCRIDDARLVLEIVAAAVHFGAVAINRSRVERVLIDEASGAQRVTGAEVLDRETEATVKVSATVTLNCTGPWRHRLAGIDAGPAKPVRQTKGVHLVLPALPTDDAILVATRDGRSVMLLPWYGRTLVGTTATEYRGTPGFARSEPRDVNYLLDEVNRHVDRAWEAKDVIATFAGLTSGGDWQLDATRPGLFASVGGTYTTARADMQRAVDCIVADLDRNPIACVSADRPLPWAPDEPYDDFRASVISQGLSLGLDETTAAIAASRHGTRVTALFEVLAARRELAARIAPNAPFCLAEVVVAARDEMARSLVDVLRRRVPLLLLARPDAAAVERVAALARESLNWSAKRCGAEVDSILRPHSTGQAAT